MGTPAIPGSQQQTYGLVSVECSPENCTVSNVSYGDKTAIH